MFTSALCREEDRGRGVESGGGGGKWRPTPKEGGWRARERERKDSWRKRYDVVQFLHACCNQGSPFVCESVSGRTFVTK